MKGLSLTQPWGFAVVHLGKMIENRRWNTNFRGDFFIHASAGLGRRVDFSDSCESIRDVLTSDPLTEERWHRFRDEHLDIRLVDGDAVFLPRGSIQRGGIIGIATLAQVIPPCRAVPCNSKRPAMRTLFASPCPHRWHAPMQFGFRLENIRPTTFVPFKGALSFFEVPDDVARKALGQATTKDEVHL